MPVLYVVATPIGNMADITLRAIETLRSVKLIAAEDTRETRKLLSAYKIRTPMTSYHENNKRTKLGYLLDVLKESDVALVSDAGTPGISDPGHDLIVAASQRGVPVVPIPGPSVVVAALVVSGLPTDRFTYLGFLPRRGGARRQILSTVLYDPATMIVPEAPHRVLSTLSDLLEVFGDRRIAVCRELTKLHEEVFRGTIGQAIEHFAEPRGEFTLVVEGQTGARTPQMTGDIERQLDEMRRSGMLAREAVATLSRQTGLPKKELYRAWLKRA
ncbi:MAG: 16S rRNA (cytidine(1402)-2'-O)-methyltransferase [Chloroflexi bacterium]|nr:16S rRNA (cytidine(1402)-2'-O)-methyltransferase [Chloroflexota bacterium]